MGWTVPLQSLFLALIRVIWGSQLIIMGLNRLKDIPATVEYFTTLGIPQPQNTAWAVGLIEAVCGLLLVTGLLSRLAAFPLTIILCGAYFFAHSSSLGNFDTFTQQTPFLFLIASLLVLCFGPGKMSLDHLIRSKAGK
jgi:putative oxidoreductase